MLLLPAVMTCMGLRGSRLQLLVWSLDSIFQGKFIHAVEKERERERAHFLKRQLSIPHAQAEPAGKGAPFLSFPNFLSSSSSATTQDIRPNWFEPPSLVLFRPLALSPSLARVNCPPRSMTLKGLSSGHQVRERQRECLRCGLIFAEQRDRRRFAAYCDLGGGGGDKHAVRTYT